METVSDKVKHDHWAKEPPRIFAAMAEVMASIGKVEKTGVNQHDRYRYKTIDDMYAAVRVAMGKARVFPTLEVVEIATKDRQSKSGSYMAHTSGKARVHFWAEDGSSISTDVVAEATDRGDKGAPKWESMAMKTALIATFLLSDGEQLDTEQESPEFAAEPTEVAAPKPTKQPRRRHDPTKDSLTTAQIGEIGRLQKALGIDPKQGEAMCKDRLGCSKSELTEDKAAQFIAVLETAVEKAGAQ